MPGYSKPRRGCTDFLSGLCFNHHQSQTGDQRDRTEDRRDRESVLSLVGDLYGTDIDVLFFMREGDSTGRIADDAKEDEKYSNDGGWLHEMKTFPERRANVTRRQMLRSEELDALEGDFALFAPNRCQV